MVKSHKKSKVHSKKSNKSVKRSSHSKQRGGQLSGACLSGVLNGTPQTANIQNTNPQALLDLDNKFNSYGGPVPLNQMGGGSTCGDEGVGTGNPKSNTFKSYLESMSNKLDIAKGGGTCGDIKKQKVQKGSGYVSNPEKSYGGLMGIDGYDDCCPPAIIGGQMRFGSPDQAICGAGSVGGGRRYRKSKKSKKSKKTKKTKHSRKHKKSMHRGGADYVNIGTKPMPYPEAFNGPLGLFRNPDNLMEHTFGGVQPNYGPTDI